MIEQARFSKGVGRFAEPFMSLWGLKEYNDPNKPAIFVGVYTLEDVHAINKHRGLKVVWNTGGRRDIFTTISRDAIVFGYDVQGLGYKHKNVYILFRDQSLFTPTPLGKSVYFYIGDDKQKETYGYSRIKALESSIPHPIIYGKQGKTIEFVRDNYYAKSFVNLKLDRIGGYTSALEMGLMGRKTIGNIGSFNYECDNYYLSFASDNDIINHISNEAKYIGQIRNFNFNFTGQEWKNESFWL